METNLKGPTIIERKPMISIIITAYNRLDFIDQALESVTRQTLDPSFLQVILLTNFDYNLNLMRSKYHSIFVIKANGTIGHFLYLAMLKAEGEIIAFLDDDDIWVNNKLEIIMNKFLQNNDIYYYHNSVEYIDIKAKEIKYKRPLDSRKKYLKENGTFAFSMSNPDSHSIKFALMISGDFNLSSICIRRSLVSSSLVHLLRVEGSTDAFFFWLSIISGHTLYFDFSKLTKYRLHNHNSSSMLTLSSKYKELNKQIKTYDILIDIGISDQTIKNNYAILAWLDLYRNEELMLFLIFSESKRKEVLHRFIKLIKINRKLHNHVRQRIELFTIVYIFFPRLAILIYTKLTK